MSERISERVSVRKGQKVNAIKGRERVRIEEVRMLRRGEEGVRNV